MIWYPSILSRASLCGTYLRQGSIVAKFQRIFSTWIFWNFYFNEYFSNEYIAIYFSTNTFQTNILQFFFNEYSSSEFFSRIYSRIFSMQNILDSDVWRMSHDACCDHDARTMLLIMSHSTFRVQGHVKRSTIDLWLILFSIMLSNLANWGHIDRSCKVFTVYSNILWSISANTFQMNTFRNIFRRILLKRILCEYYFSEYLAREYEYFLQIYSKKYSNTWATIEPWRALMITSW